MEQLKCLQGLVKGRVQGVFFRAETQRQATMLGIGGWVRNTPEGHVELLLCGNDAALQSMREWLGHGPAMAHVDALELRSVDCELHQHFEIRS